MARVIHDIHCIACDVDRFGVAITDGIYPVCLECGGPTTWTPSKVTTDVFTHEQYSDAAGRSFTSQGQKEKYMARHGYHGAGDKVGGARKDLSIRGTGFSYAGQGSRVSVGERR